MCGGSPKVNNSAASAAASEAEAARKREEKRKADKARGRSSINSQFSRFNDDFYNQRRDAYMDYATPQLESQHKKAKDNMTFNLARGNNLRSQAGIDQLAELAQAFQFQQANLVNEADRQRQILRDSVENERQALFNQLDASANADAAANSALTRSTFLSEQKPNFSPLGDLFANVAMAGGSNYLAGRRHGEQDRLARGHTLGAPGLPGKRGSGKVFRG